MDNLKDILSKHAPQEPDEIKIIKEYVRERFKAEVVVIIQPKQIIIGANSAALASTLQLHRHELTQVCQTDKKLVIRIGI